MADKKENKVRELTPEEKEMIKEQLSGYFKPRSSDYQPLGMDIVDVPDKKIDLSEGLDKTGEERWQNTQSNLDEIIKNNRIKYLEQLRSKGFLNPREQDEVQRIERELNLNKK